MNSFHEKIIILSRLDSGDLPTLYLKNRNGSLEARLQIDEEFDYLIITNGKDAQREETKYATPDFEFDGIFACGVYRGDKLISYGSCGKFSKQEFIKIASKQTYSQTYDDWQIATENYYAGSIYDKADDNAKTNIGEEKSKQDKSGGNNLDENDESGDFTKKSQDSDNGNQAVEHSKSSFTTERRYYDKVRCSVENILDGGKKYSKLSSLIPFSRFVEIAEGNKRYYLGIQGEKPDYIIYAVKGKSEQPPNGFSESFFIPDDLFFKTNSGYYLTLVSCENGKTILKNVDC